MVGRVEGRSEPLGSLESSESGVGIEGPIVNILVIRIEDLFGSQPVCVSSSESVGIVRNSSIVVDLVSGVRLLGNPREEEPESYPIGLVTPFVIASGDLAGLT